MPFITSLPYIARRALAALALPLLLSACATVGAPGGKLPGATAAAPRAYHDAIALGGRLSVRYQQNGADQAMHGSFTWEQEPGRTLVTLSSPLGQTLATIVITPTLSTLTQAGQPPRSAPNVDALAAEALGWPLPLSGLRGWLQGFAIDAHGQAFVAAPQGDAGNTITRDGWALNYASWQTDPGMPGVVHPRRIDLERSTRRAGEVLLRIVIDAWQPLSGIDAR
jgi:outer membrane lipoprotein LolB